MTELFGLKIPHDPWIVLSLIFLAALILAYAVHVFILWILRRIFQRGPEEFNNRFYRLVETYLFPLLIVASLIVILDYVPLSPKVLRTARSVLVFAGLLIGIFLLARAVLMILANAANRYEPLRNIQSPIEIAVKILFIAVGGMILLDTLGISITPIITTLGIGSLAVAIALQDTLGNFFAGLYIRAERPIKIGHYVKLEQGEEGYVDHIGWRSTRIRMLSNNMVIVPNNKLVQSIIINYHLPEPELAVLFEVGIHYDSDLEKVDRVTCEAAKEVLQTVPGSVPSFEPFIRYHSFADSSIKFTVILRAREFTDAFLLKHELLKKLQVRYEQEGIVIPYPIRTVVTQAAGKDDKEAEVQN